MSKKSNLRSYQTITGGDMSQASITSEVTNIQWQDNIGIQLNFIGTPTGSFAVQVSIDYAQDSFGNVSNAGNWIALTLTPSPVAAGAPDNIYIDLNQLSSPWIRVVYTRASSTGTLNAFITAKEV